MSFLNLDLKKILIALTVITLVLMALNMERNPGDKPWFMSPLVYASGLVQNAYSSFSSGVRGNTNLYLNLIDIKTNNRNLLNENAKLRAQLGALTELKLENQRLNNLLKFKKSSNMNLLAAKVIGKDLLPDHASLTINRGETHGLQKNMAAITTGGVVGYIVDIKTFTSQILLLTDRYAAIDAIVQRSRARGIVEGASNKLCNLNYLQREDDVQVGDLIVTSGLDNIFPKGFPIGTVTDVNKSEYSTTQSIELKPAINPFTLEEIFIVLDVDNDEIETPSPEPLATESIESAETL